MREILKKHCVLYLILSIIIEMPLTWLAVDPLFKKIGVNYQYTQAGYFLSTLIVALVLKRAIWGKSSLKLEKADYKHTMLKFGWFGVLGAVGAFFSTMSEIDLSPKVKIFIGYILMNIMIAISEEYIFRKLILGLLLNDSYKQRKFINIILIASVLFGLRHLFNLMFYSNQIVTCSFQAVATALSATYLIGIYFLTGNIWYGVIIHFIEDMGVTALEMFSSKAAMDSTIDIPVIQGFGIVAFQIPYLILGIIMIKKYYKLTREGKMKNEVDSDNS